MINTIMLFGGEAYSFHLVRVLGEEAGVQPPTVKVVDVRDVPSTDPGRIGKIDVLITYQLDPTHIYMVRIPKEEFTEAKVREVIKRDVEEKRRWVGKELTL